MGKNKYWENKKIYIKKGKILNIIVNEQNLKKKWNNLITITNDGKFTKARS